MKLSTRLSIAMVMLVLLTVAAVGLLTYHTIEAALVPRALERIDSHAKLLALELAGSVQSAPADVVGFRTGAGPEGIIRAHLNGGIDPADGTPGAQWERRLGSRIVAIVASKPSYQQFRLIGIADGGREVLRVDRVSASAARLVPDSEKQRMGHTDYFKAAIEHPPGEVYVSPIERDRKEGASTIAAKLLLHVATPIHAADGKLFGIFVVSIDMGSIFARLRAASDSSSLVHVVDANGEYLVHPNLSATDRLQDEFPALAGTLGAPAGSVRMVTDRSGERFGAAVTPLWLAGSTWIAVVEAAPYAAIMAPALAVRNAILTAAFVAILGAFALAIWLSRSIARPLVKMTDAVRTFARNGRIAVPTDARGEVGVLARAFAGMSGEVRDKTVALEREISERRRLFDTSLDLILVVDRRGNFLRVSPSSRSILGYEPQQMVGRNAVEFIYADDLERTRNEMRKARRGQHIRNFETRYKRRDGGIVTLAWTGVWSEPEQQHFFIGRDMTEQKRAQDMFRLVVEACPSGMIMFDRSDAIVMVNTETERLFGYSRDELIGGPLTLLVPEGMRANVTGNGVPDSPSIVQHARDPVGVRKDGTKFPIEIGVNPLEAHDNKLILGVIIDISERRRNDRLKDEFVSTVSHELRTPLTSIAGSLGLLVGGAGGQMPAPTMKLLKIAQKNSERLVRLINDILDIEKIESGKIVFNLQRVEVFPLIEQAIEANRGFAEGFGVGVRLDAEASPVFVRADSDRLVQVVINLLSNAVKFSPRGDEVTVTIEQAAQSVRILVRDRGAGIPAEFKPRVFEKFAQADATDTRQKGGTGLGLSIVKQIVTMLGGKVGFETAPGGGTVFYVDLPRWDIAAGGETTASDREMYVLICDDDAAVAQAIAERLELAGLRSDIALTGHEAIAKARIKTYDAILVDLVLPDHDGISLIQALRSAPRHQNTPIVVLSADPARGRDDIRSASLDVLDWLNKPIDIQHLVEVLDRPLARGAGKRPHVLHIDDDASVLQVVAGALDQACDVTSVPSIAEARRALATRAFDLAVVDLMLSQASGLDLLPDLRDPQGNAISVILYSAKAANGTNSAQVQAALNKSHESINHLIATLRKHVATCHVPAPRTKEVA